MSNEYLFQVVKALMLKHIDLQEQFAALRMVLLQKGSIHGLEMTQATERMHSALGPLRESVERLGAEDPQLLDQLLRNFEGPLQ